MTLLSLNPLLATPGDVLHARVKPENAKRQRSDISDPEWRNQSRTSKKAKLNRPHRAKPLPGLAQLLHNCVLWVPTVFVASTRARGAKVPRSGARRAQRRLPRDTLRRRAVCLSGCALSSLHQLECATHQLLHQLECGTLQLECGTGTAPIDIPEALPPVIIGNVPRRAPPPTSPATT